MKIVMVLMQDLHLQVLLLSAYLRGQAVKPLVVSVLILTAFAPLVLELRVCLTLEVLLFDGESSY